MVSRRTLEFIGLSKEKIVDCACAMIEAHGAEKLTTKRVANALGVSAAHVSKYFHCVGDILDAAQVRVMSMLLDVHRDVMVGHSGREALEAYALVERTFAQAYPRLYAMAFAEHRGNHAQIGQLMKNYRALPTLMICAYLDIDNVSATLAELAHCVGAALQGLALSEISGRAGSLIECDQTYRRMLDILDHACAAGRSLQEA